MFEEQGVVKTPFYGGYGVIAEGGVPKAAFNAFAMLHKLGEQRVAVKQDNVLATKRADGSLAIAVWNYAPPGQAGQARQIRLAVDGWPNAKFTAEVLDPRHGSALADWEAMGKPASPTQAQYEQLRTAAGKTLHVTGNSVELQAHGLALFEVRQQQPRKRE